MAFMPFMVLPGTLLLAAFSVRSRPAYSVRRRKQQAGFGETPVTDGKLLAVSLSARQVSRIRNKGHACRAATCS